MSHNTFYITTPIYYVNSHPHLGTLYSTLIADTLARWQKLLGKKVFLLTGTDEHGQKIYEQALKAGVEPQQFVDTMVPAFKEVWKMYGIEYDAFIRTTDQKHKQAVTHFISQLCEQEDIYKAEYVGLYCVPCEAFVTQSTDTPVDAHGKPLCPTHKRPLQEIAEESYFFRLSAYQDQLLAFYEQNPHFIIPKERLQEVISFVKSGLKDLSISRKTVSWGIPFPGDPSHTVYVWGDALTNYISAIGYGDSSSTAQQQFAMWWPAQMHVMAKDIVKFHAVYWPAFLMSLKLPLPKQLLVHGYILMDDAKMSKSLGNAVDPKSLSATYGTDQVRYYLMRQMAITHDGSFSLSDLEMHLNAELANNLGNLLNRTVSLAINNKLTHVTPCKNWTHAASHLLNNAEEAYRAYWDAMNHGMIHIALAELWKFISRVNAFFHEQQPWVTVKQHREAFEETISAACHSLYMIGVLASPIMPTKARELLAALGIQIDLETDYDSQFRVHSWNRTFVLTQMSQPLFVRIEPASVPAAATSVSVAKPTQTASENNDFIGIEDVVKVHLVVGTISSCEPVSGSDKLYKMQVDLGDYGQRQILAGVAKVCPASDLLGKQGVYVANLKPRKLMGLESQGMMLFAEDSQGMMRMVTPAYPVKNGTRLR